MLVALDDLKGWLGIDQGDASLDPQITIALEGAEGIVESLLGRELGPFDGSERVGGHGDDTVYVPHYPIVEVTDVTIHMTASTFGLSSLTDEAADPDVADLIFDSAGGIVRLDGGIFPDGEHNVEVTWRGGYREAGDDQSDHPKLPADLKLLVLKVAALHISRRGKEGIDQESIGEYSVSLRSPTSDEVLALDGVEPVLTRYRTING